MLTLGVFDNRLWHGTSALFDALESEEGEGSSGSKRMATECDTSRADSDSTACSRISYKERINLKPFWQ